ncbi:hypothetical protein C8R44DRAFT_751318 [Mycena epipterygia]|nr:hypothetical protein C8R44DRAFT_751318 [Mycena epipterygia]
MENSGEEGESPETLAGEGWETPGGRSMDWNPGITEEQAGSLTVLVLGVYEVRSTFGVPSPRSLEVLKYLEEGPRWESPIQGAGLRRKAIKPRLLVRVQSTIPTLEGGVSSPARQDSCRNEDSTGCGGFSDGTWRDDTAQEGGSARERVGGGERGHGHAMPVFAINLLCFVWCSR